jgi:hypothetical protein
MVTRLGVVAGIAGAAIMIFAAPAHAGCADWPQGVTPPVSRPTAPFAAPRAHLLPAVFLATSDRDEPEFDHAGKMPVIVGLWKFVFVAKGNPAGPPDGTVLDTGYAAWHSDGTEITNSGGRPPPSQSFCMGVWKQVGHSTFKLNHVALSWSSDGTTFVGPGTIREVVTVDRSGNRFEGAFGVVQYDASEVNVLAHVVGTVTGTRVTAD